MIRLNDLRAPRGMTLVELMVVVAIVAVLAALGGVSYMRYIKEGKIAKLRQYAMEVQAGQEQYKSRNGYYLDIDDPYYNSSASVNEKWEELLDFHHPNFKDVDITVRTDAGSAGESCSDSKVCVSGMSPSTTKAWYAISVTQDMDPQDSKDTIIYLDSDVESPVLVNEGS